MSKYLNEKITQYSFLALLLIFAILTYLILLPYFSYILLGIILAFAFYPLHVKINNLVKNQTTSAFLTILIMFLVVLGPLLYISLVLIRELSIISNVFTTFRINDIEQFIVEKTGYYIDISSKLLDLSNALQSLILKKGIFFFSSLFEIFIGTLLLVTVVYYSLKEGKEFYNLVKRYAPLKKHHADRLFSEVEKVTQTIIYSQFIAALSQAVAAAIGYKLFQVDQIVFWSFITFIFAFIPFLGAPFIWGFLTILKLINQEFVAAFGLFLWGVIVVSNIDNIIRAKFVSNKANIHPLVVFIGFMGGIKVFGIVGVVLGPVILSLFITLLKFYSLEFF